MFAELPALADASAAGAARLSLDRIRCDMRHLGRGLHTLRNACQRP